MKLIKYLWIFIIFVVITCGKEEKLNKAEQELAKLPYATLDEITVKNALIYGLMIAPASLPYFEAYILPPWPMESEQGADNCPRVTDKSSEEDVYIVNEGNCTDRFGFVWERWKSNMEGKV